MGVADDITKMVEAAASVDHRPFNGATRVYAAPDVYDAMGVEAQRAADAVPGFITIERSPALPRGCALGFRFEDGGFDANLRFQPPGWRPVWAMGPDGEMPVEDR